MHSPLYAYGLTARDFLNFNYLLDLVGEMCPPCENLRSVSTGQDYLNHCFSCPSFFDAFCNRGVVAFLVVLIAFLGRAAAFCVVATFESLHSLLLSLNRFRESHGTGLSFLGTNIP